MYRTPASKVLTRRQRQELMEADGQEAPLEDCKKLSRDRSYSCGELQPNKLHEMEEFKSEPLKQSSLCGSKKSTRHVAKGSVKSKNSTGSSAAARRKQLELEAAEAKAKIQIELIDKQLQVKLAAIDMEDEEKQNEVESESSSQHGSEVPNEQPQSRVETWLERDCKPPKTSEEPSINIAIQHLASALKNMVKDQSSSQQDDRLISRLATPRELPLFNGDCIEWLHFKSAYEESTRVCQFSESENLWRLRKALRGDAMEAVTDLLIGNTGPQDVMDALELRFGRSDLIILNITAQLKRLTPLPSWYHQDIINFSVRVNNCVATIRALGQQDYLRSPELTTAVLSKLPNTLIGKWTDFAYEKLAEGQPRLELLAAFLKRESLMLCSVGFPQPREPRKYPEPQNRKIEDIKQRGRPIFTTTALENDSNCNYCRKSNHELPDCRIFRRALRKERWRFVKTSGLCYCCLISHHACDTCPAPVCDIDNCGLAHHPLLHWKKPTQQLEQTADYCQEQVSPASDVTIAHVTANNDNTSCSSSDVMLKVVPVTLRGPNGTVSTFALLDDAASVSMIDSALADSLGLKSEQSSAIKFIDAFGLEVYQSDAPKVRTQISPKDNSTNIHDVMFRKVSKLNLPMQNLSVVSSLNYTHLLPVKDLVCKECVIPRLLIGEDNYFLIAPLEVLHGNRNAPYATRCQLGWSIHGYCGRTRSSVSQPIFHLAHTDVSMTDISELNNILKKSFDFDAIGISPLRRENTAQVRALQILENTARKIGNQWEVGLPFNRDEFVLPSSYEYALTRQRLLIRKFKKDNAYAQRYTLEIQKLFDSNYARKLTSKEQEGHFPYVWYLAHFGVSNPNKPGKLRLVFDAAGKVNGVCLNDYLITGPDLYNSLFDIMLRFRENRIVIIGDIKDMFLRIKIRNEDQHVLRFLWQESENSPIQHCIMDSLIFGATCSPFIAQFIKNKNALMFEDLHPEAILNSHYMDDCLYSTTSEENAIKLVRDISMIHKEGGFEIRGWSSNSKQVLESIPTEALAQSSIHFKDGATNTSERTLGLLWHPNDDSFSFKISFDRIPEQILSGMERPTKAKMLSIIMSVYDIHGFLSPFTIKAKMILQSVHRSGIDWQCCIRDEDHVSWMRWLGELKLLDTLRIPRWYHIAGVWTQCYTAKQPGGESSLNDNLIVMDTQMHIFCDASIKAYAAVIYWRFIRSDGKVMVCFAASKSRVTPLRPISIPRLELQGAMVGARLANTVQQGQSIKPSKRYFWTDSSTVLQWIRSDPRNYKAFVAHRLGEIDELTSVSEWRHVPSGLNVADRATKENTPPLQYHDEWFQGPNFLCQPEECWPKDFVTKKINEEAICEARNINLLVTKDINNLKFSLPDENKFSLWIKLKRVLGRILLFIRRCQGHTAVLDATLINEAEQLLIKKSQHDSFSSEILCLQLQKPLPATSRLLNLTPFLDQSGLLRVGGRINKASGISEHLMQPYILDGKHRMSKLLVDFYHRQALHGANELVVNELRQRYWVINLRPTVRDVASRCLFCRYRRAVPQPQRMADLPAARLQHNRKPFYCTGIDYFGPMEVTVGRRRLKRYGVLFTCLTIRAIHIEVTEDLTADAAIMALRRMSARRGQPSVIYSDNGTNLRGAASELKQSLAELNLEKLTEDGSVRGIDWRFIPPGSPEMGGAWERMVRTVKTALKVVLSDRAPHPETLTTMLAEVEALVNSRPLTHVSVDPNFPEALTPNHFLIGTSANSPSIGKYDNASLNLRKRWRVAQRLTDMFWDRWLKEYLPTLLPRQKWLKEGGILGIGDYVQLVEPNVERGCWRHGVVSATHVGDDGRVRIVDVRTRTGVLRRPVTRVALLAPSEESSTK